MQVLVIAIECRIRESWLENVNKSDLRTISREKLLFIAMSSEFDILEQVLTWSADGEPVALATVIQTWGSAPRPVGSQMGINASAEFVGSVSGGCVEGAVIEEALEMLETGKMRRLEYGVTNDQAWELGLPCGGTIEIMLQCVSKDAGLKSGVRAADIEEILGVKESHRPRLLATNIETFETSLFERSGPHAQTDQTSTLTADAVNAVFHSQTSQTIEAAHESWFLRLYTPPLRLIIVGAVHIAEHLSTIAQAAGYAVTIVDPRPAFASADRFGDATILVAWPDEVMAELSFDARTALVALTHDPKLDDAALMSALAGPCFYVGALGSRKNQAKRLERLKQNGLKDEDLARIHGPVGLPIGAQSPAEIAIAIAAEMTAALRAAGT